MKCLRNVRQLTTSAFVAAVALISLAAQGCGSSYPKCSNDDDCKSKKEYCVNGQCQQCRADADCGAGKRCAAGRCEAVEGYCENDGQCGPGNKCENNRCTTTTSSSSSDGDLDLSRRADADGGCRMEPVYFDYDSSELLPSIRNRLAENARCIKQRGVKKVHITGQTDPRGTEEYNMALGDRRARSVKDYIQSLGVEGGAVGTSSVGEELATGKDEESWAKDRKAEFSAE